MDDGQMMGNEQMENESKDNVKEKAKKLVLRCKGMCVDAYATSTLFSRNILQKTTDNKRRVLMVLTAVLVVVGIGAASIYLLNWWKYKDESPTFSSIRKSELLATGEVGSKVIMGDLEITLQKVVEGSYRPLELDAQGNRITRNYLSAQIMMFNTGYKDKYFLLVGLEDGKGGQYERDTDVEFYMNELKDFGPAKEIYPRTIREGHLNFQAPDADATNLKLTIVNETTNQKVTFDITR